MFLKNDYGSILDGTDKPTPKGIILTIYGKKPKEFLTVKRFTFSHSANAVAFTFENGSVAVLRAEQFVKVVDVATGKAWEFVEV